MYGCAERSSPPLLTLGGIDAAAIPAQQRESFDMFEKYWRPRRQGGRNPTVHYREGIWQNQRSRSLASNAMRVGMGGPLLIVI
ncbi:hypothetical protein [Mesorhizobium sp. ZC-5]|uniref:hypothetical protein n=1 Tax=Mesorhizobium sp. ZC-5 TaxID=2986066 RepID=UPI0021E7320F|nr:hypothetical protein [Mesorhizobium sp. ZC-5]MCV3240647.1 hypothetical protein [Mesorhizobium sp. ZC-5]